MGGRKTVSSVTTIPAEVVMGDEWDRTSDPNVAEQLESRLRKAEMFRAKSQRGMFIKFSSPETEAWGVTKDYDDLSDQMVFQIKCTKCNEWQEMQFPDSIANFYEKGQKKHGELWYKCLKCDDRLDFSEIGKWNRAEPLKIHNCEWVPKKKEYYDEVTRYGEGVRGYKVPWAFSAPVDEIIGDRDTKSVMYFHHHVLGIPYQDRRSGLTSDVLKSISKADLKFGYEPNAIHVMGVDQGCYIVVWRLVPNSRKNMNPIGRWQVVLAEFSPDQIAFKTFIKGEDGTMFPKSGRLSQLMDNYHITLCVIDAEPSGNDARNFQMDFEKKVWVNHSTKVSYDDPLLGFKWQDKETDSNLNEIWVCRISEDKTGAFDAYYDFVYSGNLELPLYEDEMKTFINHHLAVKKTTREVTKAGAAMSLGLRKYETLYYNTGDDHYANASKFAYEAACLYWRLDYLNFTTLITPGNIDGIKWRNGEPKKEIFRRQ